MPIKTIMPIIIIGNKTFLRFMGTNAYRFCRMSTYYRQFTYTLPIVCLQLFTVKASNKVKGLD